MITLKNTNHNLLNLAKKYYFVFFAALSMFIPDLMLRYLVWPKAYPEFYVEPVARLFSAAWIFLVLFLCIVVLPEKFGKIIYGIWTGSMLVYAFCQYVYFKIFGQFFWLKSIALAGEGADYLEFAVKYIDLKLLVSMAASLFSLVFALIKWQKPKLCRIWWLVLMLPVTLLFMLNIFMNPETFNDSQDDWDSWRKPRVIYKQFSDVNKSFDVCGLYQFVLRDLYNTAFPKTNFTPEEYAKADSFFNEKGSSGENEYSGLFEGKNVVAVMMEGLDTWMIDEKYTPTLCYMMENGINFTNYCAPMFGTGHTFNSEFAFNTGYYNPLTSVSAVNFSSNHFPYSMANLFRDKGYTANSFHYNESEFYNRGIMHHSLGFESYNSFPDFGMTVDASMSDSNILKNDAIYKKMSENQPFFDFVIAYSGHVPYTFDDAKLAEAKSKYPELIDAEMTKTQIGLEKNNCLILAKDTDEFFRQLLERLDADGILDNTVIIGFTDHYAYGFSDQKALEEYKSGENLYEVPAFIYSPCLAEKDMNTQIEKPAQTIDFLPTIVNLFGLENNNCYIGNDLLDKNISGFVFFGNKAWLDEKMYYVPSDTPPPADIKEYVQKQNAYLSTLFKINDIVVSGDYFSHKD